MRNTKNPETVILALSLDKKRNRKRVVIGEERQVHMRIRRIGNSDVLYDKERTLGPLIFDHEKQLDKDWNIKVIHPLRNALSATADRENRAASILKHLEQNEQSDDPIYIYLHLINVANGIMIIRILLAVKELAISLQSELCVSPNPSNRSYGKKNRIIPQIK